MNLKERIKELCRERGKSMNQVEKELGFGVGYISKLDKSTPNVNKIQQLANYFNVSPNYLLTDQEEHESKILLTPKDERDITKDVESIMSKLASKEFGPAAYDGEELSEESAALFRDELEIALRRLKLINKEKYNPHKNKK